MRENKGLTQQALASALHVRRETVNYWETDSRDIKTGHTIELADFFGVSADYILGRTKDIKGNADVMAVEKQFGLSPIAQEKLKLYHREQKLGEYSDKQLHQLRQKVLRQTGVVINAILESDHFYKLSSELRLYIIKKPEYTDDETFSDFVDFVNSADYETIDPELRRLMISPDEKLSLLQYKCEKEAVKLMESIMQTVVIESEDRNDGNDN